MSIRIVEIHPADNPKALNTEWFVVENDGDVTFSTRNCTLSVSRKGSKKKTELGTIDPGFAMAPGSRARVITGNPGRKAHGKPPTDDLPNYNLFLNGSVLRGPGSVLTFSLRSHTLAFASFDPTSKTGIAAED